MRLRNSTRQALAIKARWSVQQQIVSLADGGAYTLYVWAKVASGTRKISLAIPDNAYATYLAGPTRVALATS